MVALELVQAVAATTCRSQWRRDARVLGSPLLCSLGSTHTVRRVLLPVAFGTRSLWVASPGVMSEPPASLVGVGVAALSRSTIARWQESAGLPYRGCPPHGFWASRRSGVDGADSPALAVGKLSLWDASPGVLSRPLS